VLSKSELSKTQFKRQPGTKLPVKHTWSEKITVLSTFLESSLNFLSNDIKKLQNQVKSERKVLSILLRKFSFNVKLQVKNLDSG